MFNVKYGLAFKSNEDGSVVIFRNKEIIATLTKNTWISIITHMAKINKPLDEIYALALKLHTDEGIITPGYADGL